MHSKKCHVIMKFEYFVNGFSNRGSFFLYILRILQNTAFADSVTAEHLYLALGGGAAVTAHGWKDERLGADSAKSFDGCRDDRCQVTDAAAADGDGHRFSGANAGGGRAVRDLLTHDRCEVGNDRRIEPLPYADHSWVIHGSDKAGHSLLPSHAVSRHHPTPFPTGTPEPHSRFRRTASRSVS